MAVTLGTPITVHNLSFGASSSAVGLDRHMVSTSGLVRKLGARGSAMMPS